MGFNPRFSVGALVSVLLVTLLAVPPSLRAQQHVVGPADIHEELVNATEKRRQNRDKVMDLFSSKESEKALKGAGMDPGQVRSAVAMLKDAELAALAARSDKLRDDFAAGAFTNRELLIIVVVVAVIILVIVAV
ncbi:MAG TPA: PA2779 family protein [Aridibacter sp.]|nr:PA2779 family protein [Aridibacter sp.]